MGVTVRDLLLGGLWSSGIVFFCDDFFNEICSCSAFRIRSVQAFLSFEHLQSIRTDLFLLNDSTAIGVPCAVFGLSPLFLSSLASFFTTTYDRFPSLPGTSETELDPGRWLLFLAGLLAIVNGVGGFFLKELPWEEEEPKPVDKLQSGTSRVETNEEAAEVDERTSLLPSRTRSRSNSHHSHHSRHSHHSHHRPHHHHHPHSQTLRQFVSTPTFWLFGSLILLSTGPVEMYMASLGQILESLLAISTSTTRTLMTKGVSHALQARKNHIAVLAIANTVSRLLVGAISDYLSTPTPIQLDAVEGEEQSTTGRGSGRRRVSRLVFLMGACAGLALVYTWGGTGLATEDGLWIVTISTSCLLFHLLLSDSHKADTRLSPISTVNGTSYGAVFTLAPAIVRSCWPVEHFGRNWGLLT